MINRTVFCFFVLVVSLVVVQPALAADTGELDSAVAKLPGYKFGDDRQHLEAIEIFIRSKPTASQIAYAEKQLLGVLEGETTTTDAKRFVCRMLRLIGTETSVPALSKLLSDDELSHMARYALETMPGEKAGAALRDAMEKTEGKLRVGIINSIGARGDAKAVDALAKLVNVRSDKEAVAKASLAAIDALGRIPSQSAGDALAKLSTGEPKPPFDRSLTIARLDWAYRMLEDGDRKAAAATFEKLMQDGDAGVSTAARRGLVLSDTGKSLPIVLETARLNHAAARAMVAAWIRNRPSAEDNKALAKVLPDLPPQMQVVILNAWADVSAPVHETAVKQLGSGDQQVRIAAVRALGAIGTKEDVSRLAQFAVSENDALAVAAQGALVSMPGKGADDALLDIIEKDRGQLAIALLKVVGDRGNSEAVPRLLKVADSFEGQPQHAALAALGATAQQQHIDDMVRLLGKMTEDSGRTAAERAIIKVTARLDDRSSAIDVLIAAHSKATGPTRSALVRVLGSLGGDQALAAVKADTSHRDKDVQDAAVRTLCDWKSPAAASALLALAKDAESLTHRVLALRGYVRLVELPTDRPANETLAMLKLAMEAAPRTNEKRLVLGSVGQVKTIDALKYVAGYLEHAELKGEAATAAVTIASALDKSKDDAVDKVLKQVITTNAQSSAAKQARKLLDRRSK